MVMSLVPVLSEYLRTGTCPVAKTLSSRQVPAASQTRLITTLV